MPVDASALKSDLELVLLDRDGVINHDSPEYIKSIAEWRPISGALEAIACLQRKYAVMVCTNQSALGRGLIDDSTLAGIHEELNEQLRAAGGQPVDVLFCPHLPDAGCNCRKPAPGLLRAAMQMRHVAPHNTIFVGDSERDLLAAKNADCRGVLLLTGNGARARTTDIGQDARWVFADLAELAAALSADRL